MAADLDVDPEAASSTLQLSVPIPLEIQIKLRSQTLGPGDLRELVFKIPKKKSRGPAPRAQPVQRLQAQPHLRYTLITTCQVHRDLRDFVVPQVGALSKAKELKRELAPKSLLERIGIMAEWTPRLVTREIESLLARSTRVPLQNVQACHDSLVENVRLRLLDRRDAILSREELATVLREHGGSPTAATPQFVPPRKHTDVLNQISAPPFAVIITGMELEARVIEAQRVEVRLLADHV